MDIRSKEHLKHTLLYLTAMAGLVSYNFTIDDASPVVAYSPYSDFNSATGRGDGLRNGWQTWYTGSGYLSSFDGPEPVGESFHLTSLPGASASLSFYGTGISLYGISNCSYDVVFDGTLVPNTTLVQGVFFSTSNEEPGVHNVSITARPDDDDQILSFNRAIVTSVANATVSSPVTVSIDSQNRDTIVYTGNWTASNFVSNNPSNKPVIYYSTTASGASASLNFTGRAISVYGVSTTNHGPYSVALDGVQHVLNGSSQWLLDDMLMFYQDGLDEASTHTLSLTNLGDGHTMTLTSVNITQFESVNTESSDITSGSSKVGAIVGPVIAFAVLIGLIGLIVWTRRRDRRHPRKLERCPSVTSSIFLPPSLRREYDGRGNRVMPYKLDSRASFRSSARGSIASSNASTLCEGYPQWNVNGNDEKNEPSPKYEAGVLTARQQLPFSIPAVHTPDKTHPDTAYDLHGLMYPLPVAHPPFSSNSASVSPRRAKEFSLVERVPETTAQRVDNQSTTANNSRRESIDRLPPYPEDV